ncbi:MAG: GldG family protein [Kiritimatiellales bacterium]|nr:GldG family protein [Pontiella sp.]NNJ70999.1 GldG family protein [Kiritimatiellales bacterium]
MKRIAANLNSLFAVILALVVVQMIGFISLRNPLRVNWSGRTYYSLSEKTLNLLDELEYQVVVTVFFQEEHKLYHDVENLLEEYQYHSRNIRVEWVDPLRDLARTEQLANKYGLTEAQVVVFEIGDRSKVVRQADIADIMMESGRKQPVYRAFKGEQAFSSALLELMQDEIERVYFLVGHGEHRITDFDQLSGYSKIGTTVMRDNLDVKELMLSGEKQVPEDAAALVIAGPAKTMDSIEVEMIEDYLNRSGRVLVLIDALKETGLEPMLYRWGVGLRQDIVVDPENTLRGSDVHIRRYSDHLISAQMGSIVQFFLPRSIEPLVLENGKPATEDRPAVFPLAFTSDQSWSETQVGDSTARFDENTGDQRGPFSLGVAIERGASQEMLDVQIKPSRMVVFGDSDFVCNGSMVGGNADLFMNALNWLLDREELMAISPKPIEEVKLSLSRKQLNRMFWINVIGIPAVAMVIGLLVWVRRRK